jgi:class 3 adenylate cyclase
MPAPNRRTTKPVAEFEASRPEATSRAFRPFVRTNVVPGRRHKLGGAREESFVLAAAAVVWIGVRGFRLMARTQVVTILFCDLVASTERRARLGDDAFDEFSARLMVALNTAIAQHNGRNIASAGDGLMIVFPDSVADSVACATTMHRVVAVLDPRDPPQLSIGISTGEVAQDGDGYSGMPIVEAARLEAAASPGQTLANAVVRTLVGTRRALRFRDIGALTLKGIPAPLSAVEVIDDQVLDSSLPDEPVVVQSDANEDATVPSTEHRRWRLIIAAAAVVVAAAVGAAVSRSASSPHVVANAPAGISAPKGYLPRSGGLSGDRSVRRSERRMRASHRPPEPRQTGR